MSRGLGKGFGCDGVLGEGKQRSESGSEVGLPGRTNIAGTYKSKARVEALSEDGVAGFEDKLGEQYLVTSLVDLLD